MPRGPIIYSLPPGTTPQQPNTPILSSVFNAAMDDVAATFNTVQPVEYGGTGGNSAVGGIDGLSVKGSSIPAASITDIWAATGDFLHITGTTTITSLGLTSTAGNERTVVFDDVLTLTHNTPGLVLPGGVNIVTAAGDSMVVRSEGGGNSRVVNYQRASGVSLWETITTTTLSAGDWRGIDLSPYRDLRIRGYLLPSTDGVELRLRTSTNNGSSFDGGASSYSYFRVFGVPDTAGADGAITTQLNLSGTVSVGNDASEGTHFTVDVFNFNKPLFARFAMSGTSLKTDGTYTIVQSGGLRLSATPRNALSIFFSVGNIASGYVVLEGIRA